MDTAALHAGSGTVRLLTLVERTAVFDAVDLKRLVGLKSHRLLEVTTLVQDVDLTIEARAAESAQFDWNDSTPLIVTSWTSATRTLKFTTSRPTDMLEGDRIIIQTAASNGTGEQFVIEQFGVAADEVILVKEPSPVPVATDTIFSGGPLVDPVRDLVLAFFDNLGPAIGTTGVGNWDDSIAPARLEAIALAATNVRDATTVIPVTTITPNDPAFPADATIELLIPGEIVVRSV